MRARAAALFHSIFIFGCLATFGGLVTGFSTVAISTRALADDRAPPGGIWPAETIHRGATIAPDLTFPDKTQSSLPDLQPRVTLLRPEGDGPFPAIVMVHQCAGLNGAVMFNARQALAQKYVVLVIDSSRPARCHNRVLRPEEWRELLPRRPRCAAGGGASAQPTLRGQNTHRAGRLLMGRHGQSAHIEPALRVRSAGERDALHRSSEFYPGCFKITPPNGRPPYEIVNADIKPPLLVLMGEDDTETPAAECVSKLEAAKNAGAPVEWHIYPNTTHCWDCRGLDGRSKTDWRGNRANIASRPRPAKTDGDGCSSFSHARCRRDEPYSPIAQLRDAFNFQMTAVKRFDFGRSLAGASQMTVTVRPMTLQETAHIIAYFHAATPEHLEILGVDPSRLPPASQWQRLYDLMFDQPVEQRSSFLVSWLSGDDFFGFSTADKIRFGQQANMHLHITNPSLRSQGIGVECVKQTIELYFQSSETQATLLRAPRIQRSAEPHAAKGRIQIRQDAHDRSRPSQLSPSSQLLDDRQRLRGIFRPLPSWIPRDNEVAPKKKKKKDRNTKNHPEEMPCSWCCSRLQPKPGQTDTYLGYAKMLRPEVEKIVRFIDNIRYRSLTREGWLLGDVWLARRENIWSGWRVHARHHAVQGKGRSDVFSDYHSAHRRDHRRHQSAAGLQRVQEQRFDETQVGDATTVTLIDASRAADWVKDARPARLPPRSDSSPMRRRPGGMGCVRGGADTGRHHSDAIVAHQGGCSDVAARATTPKDARQRRVRIVRDYGQFDRREAPQYYPDVSKGKSR